MELLDTNIILRFILKDHPTLSPRAKKIINSQEIYIDPIVVAEVIWVCKSVYSQQKSDYIDPILALVGLPTNKSPYKKLITQALEFYATHNLSYVDCWLLTLSRAKSLPLATFDAKLSRQK